MIPRMIRWKGSDDFRFEAEDRLTDVKQVDGHGTGKLDVSQ